jgi:hypothetical protein
MVIADEVEKCSGCPIQVNFVTDGGRDAFYRSRGPRVEVYVRDEPNRRWLVVIQMKHLWGEFFWEDFKPLIAFTNLHSAMENPIESIPDRGDQ